LDLIRSPLGREFSDADDATKTQESWNVSFFSVVTNHNGPLKLLIATFIVLDTIRC